MVRLSLGSGLGEGLGLRDYDFLLMRNGLVCGLRRLLIADGKLIVQLAETPVLHVVYKILRRDMVSVLSAVVCNE